MQTVYNQLMSVNITIRNVPNDVRDVLASRAARSGKSLQEFLTGELSRLASTPSPVDFIRGLELQVKLDGAYLTHDDVMNAKDADRR